MNMNNNNNNNTGILNKFLAIIPFLNYNSCFDHKIA